MNVYYCGFNGFSQVPHSVSETLSKPTLQTIGSHSFISDVAITWNYIVIASKTTLRKYGDVSKKTESRVIELQLPSEAGEIRQVSASPRQLLVVTNNGEIWSHDEEKNWRQIRVGTERNALENEETPIIIRKTACGDNLSIGLDSKGNLFSLPSTQLSNSDEVFVDISVGKEHALALAESGRVYSWGGGSRGQLGHGSLSSRSVPTIIKALEGVFIKKISAGGWHSAAISQDNQVFTFGWNESGQLAQKTRMTMTTNGPECFSAVEKLLLACCTNQTEERLCSLRDYSEDGDEYRKPKEERNLLDAISVQALPQRISSSFIPNENLSDVSCGSRHTLVLGSKGSLWSFGWNKYGQLGLGHNFSSDVPEKIQFSERVHRVFCGDWGSGLLTHSSNN